MSHNPANPVPLPPAECTEFVNDQYFRALTENAPDGIALLAGDGKVRYHTTSFAKILGLNPGALLDQNLLDWVHPDDLDSTRRVFAQVIDLPGVPVTGDWRMRRNGGWRNVQATAKSLLDDPKVRGIVVNASDVTEKKRAQSEHERSTLKLTALAQMGQTVSSSLNLQTVLQKVVEEVAALLPTHEISILLAEGDELVFANVSGTAGRALKGRRMPANAGVAGAVMTSGRSIYVSGDEAEDRQYPEMARLANYFARSLLAVPLKHGDQILGLMEAVSGEPCAFDDNDLTLFESAANWAAIAIANARQHEELRRRLRETQAMADIDHAVSRTMVLDEIFPRIVDAAREIIPNTQVAVIHLLDEGQQVLEPVAVSGPVGKARKGFKMHPGEGIAGQVLAQGAAISVADVSRDDRFLVGSAHPTLRSILVAPIQSGERRLGTISVQSATTNAFSPDDLHLLTHLGTQAAIAIENARLFSEITRRAQQLEELSNELQKALHHEQTMRAQLVLADKLSALGRMVATVAHELNNPLQSIQNCLYIISHGTDSSREQYIKIASSEVDRLSNLITQLSSVYRSSSQQKLEFEPVGDALASVASLIRPHLAKHKSRYECSVDDPAVSALKIPVQFRQVFLNLCLNAVDAMQPDGGPLTVTLKQESENEVTIAFRDTGRGISEGNLSHIFEPFFTTKEMGMGLGLAICYDIVKGYGGRMSVASREGEGATFAVTVPIDRG